MIGSLARKFVKVKVFGRGADRAPGSRTQPDCIVLAPRPGHRPSDKPAVRLFVGTEPGQYRAERVFVYSVEATRDPARTYEIHLMRDLVGFDRNRWLTGFTNYRFAIPHFAGNQGRAIYNDVDQIYLDDPASLFDMDMEGHGFLALSDKDTAVMLIDCARMAPVWTIDEVRRERRKEVEAKARAVPDLWGPLPKPWHCRDEEYRAGWSKLLHFTTIHTQPWQPFPEVFAYQPNPVGHVWTDLERQAELAGVHVFTREQPSPRFRELREIATSSRSNQREPESSESLRELVREIAPASIVEIDVSRAASASSDAAAASATTGVATATGTAAEHANLFDEAGAASPRQWDLVSVRSLESLPYEDIPWIVDMLFERARRAVHVEIDLAGNNGAPEEARTATWWDDIVTAAARRHPTIRWQLVTRGAASKTCIRRGGPQPSGRPPSVWILADHKLGHTTQSVGLADSLGWPYEIKQLRFTRLHRIGNQLLGSSLLGLDRKHSASIDAPWPDVVIATGRAVSPVARWIAKQSGGRTRTVQMGRRGIHHRADAFDLSVVCGFFGYPVHPRRHETLAPLTAIHDERLATASVEWRDLFAGLPRPHVALLVGGSSAAHQIDAKAATRMAGEVAEMARRAGGSLYIVTSPRTGKEATAALREAAAGARDDVRLYEWSRGDKANPYLGCLAVADALVVTSDSESMLAEAAATDKPLYIYPVPVLEGGPARRLRARVVFHATSRPRKEKGTVRPQQGLEYVCARLIEHGIVRPPRNPAELHRRLIAAGYARPFGEALDVSARQPLRELPAVAERVRALLGVPPAAGASACRSAAGE